MKLLKLFTLSLLLLISIKTVSQTKSIEECTNSEEEFIELNSIEKCKIESIKKPSGAIETELKIAYRKVRRRLPSKPITKIVQKETVQEISSNLEANNNLDNSYVQENFNNETIKNVAIQEVLFSVVDEIPLFKKCKKDTEENNRNCFNKQISKHFAKHFYPERASEEGIKGRVFIQFTIDFKGNITDILVKSQQKSTLLEKEIKRVVDKLPKLNPGSHKTLPVNVKYSLPINLTSE